MVIKRRTRTCEGKAFQILMREEGKFIKMRINCEMVIEMEDPLLRKAYRIEEEAQRDYATYLAITKDLGLENTEVMSVLRRIYVETTIHKHLAKAIIDAMRELEKLKSLKISEKEKTRVLKELQDIDRGEVIKYFARSHLELEKDMVAIYQEIADRAIHPLFQKIAEAIKENEVDHHKLLEDLIREA